jgi:hypothetical protein
VLVALGHAPRGRNAHFAKTVDLRASASDRLTLHQYRLRSRSQSASLGNAWHLSEEAAERCRLHEAVEDFGAGGNEDRAGRVWQDHAGCRVALRSVSADCARESGALLAHHTAQLLDLSTQLALSCFSL